MALTLYHRSDDEAAAAILAGGFRDRSEPDDGGRFGVWFSRHLDCWGEQGRHLLAVSTDFDETELSAYAVEAVADEVWDYSVGDFVPCAADDVERFTWYEIPAAIINARGHVRRISAKEARLLLS